MASRIVKALKNAKSSLRSNDVAVEEPEIVAVNPPPQDPKRSQPPPTPPAAVKKAGNSRPSTPQSRFQQQQQPSPPLSPVVQKLEEARLGGAAGEHRSSPGVEFAFLVELPDTSVSRRRSLEWEKEREKEKEGRLRLKEKQKRMEDEAAAQGGNLEGGEKKQKDPAVLVEIPKSPSAQAYEVAHSRKLQDQYFNPVFEDESRTPKEGGALPSPEKVAETLKAVVVVDPAT